MSPFHTARVLLKECRILVTFTTVVVLIRGILAARRGDGYRGSLVA